jgi:hypothetical protein
MNPQLLYGIAVVPTIVGLVQVSKNAGLPSNLAPAAAVALGILAGLAEWAPTGQAIGQTLTVSWPQAVVLGISFGLSATGLYSGGQTTLSAVRNSRTNAPQTLDSAQNPPSQPPK